MGLPLFCWWMHGRRGVCYIGMAVILVMRCSLISKIYPTFTIFPNQIVKTRHNYGNGITLVLLHGWMGDVGIVTLGCGAAHVQAVRWCCSVAGAHN